jgi:hypothetical protein
MGKIILALTALLISDVTFACTAPPSSSERLNSIRSFIVTSPNKQFFVKLVPSRWQKATPNSPFRIIRKKDSYAIGFEVLLDGQFKQLWSFKSWDDNSEAEPFLKVKNPIFYLSNDGMSFVEMNPVKSSKDKSAVVIYSKGKIVNSYAPLDFGVEKLKFGYNFPVSSGCDRVGWFTSGENIAKYGIANHVKINTVKDEVWIINLERLGLEKAK